MSFYAITFAFKRNKRETGGAGRELKPEDKKKDKIHLVSVSYIKD